MKKTQERKIPDSRFQIHAISLIEILVVISIFAILGILITRSIILTISGSKRSESVIKVRNSLSYASSVIDRQLRNANSIPMCGANNDTSTLAYVDANGNPSTFSCVQSSSGIGAIASGSAVLTGTDVNITNCSISCAPGTGANPPTVTVSLEGVDTQTTGVQNADVTVTTQINLRNY